MKLKNLNRAIVAITMMLIGILPSMAYDYEVGGIYYNIISVEDKTVEVTYGPDNCYDYHIEIPSYISVLDHNNPVVSIEVNYSVISIGKFAFRDCTELTSIKIPNSVTTIGDSAFSGCTSLTSIELPNSVTTIEYAAFYDCNNISRIYIYDLVAWLNIEFESTDSSPLTCATNPQLYLNGELLNDVQIPESTTKINSCAFCNLQHIQSVTISSLVKTIGDYAFYGCKNLKDTLTLPASLEQIGYAAFYGTSYKIIKSFASTPPTLGLDNFSNIGLLYVPAESVSLYSESEGWKDIENIIPLGEPLSLDVTNNVAGKLKSVISDKTSYPDLIQELTIHGTLNSEDFKFIRENVPFLSKLDISDTDLIKLPSHALCLCKELKSIELPNSVTTIGGWAFSGCAGLTSIKLPNSVTTIESYAFNFTGLTSIEIPNSVTTIGDSAFRSCEGLTSIDIPNSVITIGDAAFAICTSLTSIRIPNSVTAIGEYTFSGCYNLTSIEIPNSVTTIGDGAFDRCIGLTSIELPNSVTTVGDSSFNGCTCLTSIELPNSVTTIGEYAFSDCTGLTSIEIPNSVTTIGDNAFTGCSALATINFNAENCVDMGSSVGSVFSNLESFSTLNIGDNVKKIPDYAFHKCASLANVNFGNSITSIGKSAFDSCPKLTSVSLPNSVTEIGEYVFYDCSALSNISIGNSVKTIEDWAFANCEDLKKLTINSSSVTVSENIISGCLKLVSCNIEETTQTTAKVLLESESKHDSYIYLEKTKSYYKNRDVITGLEPTCLQNKNYGEYNYGYGLKINDTYCPVNYDYTYSRYNDIFHTKSVEADLNYSTNATSITTNVTLDAGDSTIEWYGIYDASSDIATDNKLDKVFENLDPNTLYHISFGIKIKELPSLINWSVSTTTDALELTTSEAKATSTTSVRLLATTNSDATAGTGFEWRRYDSPEMVPSSVVGCPILDGILAGSLRNVDSTTYYQYRAFYTASSGNTYYGDWVGFFTGDADVYFEPDVRTFDMATVKDNNATVNGYVLDGTEEISSQGFEYWIENNASDTRGFDDAKTIEASGINMSATITDLAYNTTYIYRAFAITASGTTYGSEMKFTTDNDPTGVELIESEDSSFSVKLRENPATSNAWLKISGNCETNLNYTITSMTGVVVSNGSVSTDTEWNVIELTCPAGLYLLTINNDREIQTIRLIVK